MAPESVTRILAAILYAGFARHVIADRDDIRGDGVNVAARLASARL